MKTSQQTKTACVSNDFDDVSMRTSNPSRTMMESRLPARLWVETALGLIVAGLLALTLLVPRWIELLLGAAPDAGDGSIEWGLALSLAALSAVMFAFAGRTWRKHIQLLRATW